MTNLDQASTAAPDAAATRLADAHLDELVGRLDLPEKVRLLTGATMFTLHAEPKIGLREMALSDGPTGVRGLKFTGGDAVALFPNATLLAGGWDEEAAYQVGQIVAEEAERQHIHVVLGPTINLHRSALGGRLFEAYSEDPLLTGRLAASYVRGVQDARIGACLKHVVANEAETMRNSVDNRVDDKTLRELYLLPFEIALQESDAWTLMAAYNDVNGVAATEQDEINNGIVKGEWGYTGLIMSDWFATKTTAPSANGGLDLVMPGPNGPWGQALVDAVQAGEVAESVIDDHLRRLLRLADRVGALGADRSWSTDVQQPDSPVRKDQLRRLAVAGMTVLTNDGVLPLATGSRIALIGRPALDTTNMGGGSAQVNPPYSVSIAEGLEAVLGDRLTVADGVEVRTRAVPAGPQYVTDPVNGAPGVRIEFEDSDGVVLEERHSPVAQAMVGFDDDYDRPVSTVRFRAHVNVDGPIRLGVIGIGDWELRKGDETLTTTLAAATADPGEGILHPPSWQAPDELDGNAIVEAANILRPPQWTATVESASEVEARVGLAGARMLGLVVRPAAPPEDEIIERAVEAARDSDVAVVVVGLTAEQETESVDKETLVLPGRQDDLVRAVAAVARKTVVLVNAATPVLMPWLDEVDAVMVVGLPGQEGGHAVAAALVGNLEPAGRLVTSYPEADGASPAWTVEPTGGVLVYEEGAFVGYRGYAAGRAHAPAFWFGQGLGYGSWDYGEVRVAADGRATTVSVDITNTSSRSSREVVQVYLDPAESDEPVRLVGWAAATVTPGETATVDVSCDERLWRRWDESSGRWSTVGEGGELLVARGLGDVRGRVQLP